VHVCYVRFPWNFPVVIEVYLAAVGVYVTSQHGVIAMLGECDMHGANPGTKVNVTVLHRESQY
jgi:hypothetical protein